MILRKQLIGLFLLFLPFFSGSVSADAIYFRDPFSLVYDSPLNNGLTLARPGFSANGDFAFDESKTTNFSAHLSFPLYFSENTERSAGWSVAFSGGMSQTRLEDDLMVPGFYFWEASIGRATYGYYGGKEEGFLGHLEFSVRNERPTRNDELKKLENILGEKLRSQNFIFSLRMGVGQHPFGSGLVKQKISTIQTRLLADASLNYPSMIARFKIKPELFTKFIHHSVYLGVAGQLNYFVGRETGLDVGETAYSAHFGPTLQFLRENFSLQSFVRWNYFYLKNDDLFKKSPEVNLNFNFGF